MSAPPRRNAPLGASAHVDTFARDNLPPFDQWPDLILVRPEFQYPDRLNIAVELTDWSTRLAHARVETYGIKPGNRVLIRSGNNPALVAAWLAATKAGAVVVNTMPMLRAGELAKLVDQAQNA